MCRKAINGRITREGFVDYYAELNFCISNERISVIILTSIVF